MESAVTWRIGSFYRFLPIPAHTLSDLQTALRDWLADHACLGLVIVAPEGVNGTIAGRVAAVEAFPAYLAEILGVDFRFKFSSSDVAPFRRLTVVRRPEIVGLQRPDLAPESPDVNHLTPAEWHARVTADRPPLIIDTRNRYETQIGRFRGAVDPDLASFSDWGAYLDAAQLEPDQEVLIYCTGGIRCEKAILAMHERGLRNVHQLRDGILGYLAEYPEGAYEGECYVFDDRVAVDANLAPTQRYGTCPGCGLPSDRQSTCVKCGDTYVMCESCASQWPPVCGKPCRDRFQRHGP